MPPAWLALLLVLAGISVAMSLRAAEPAWLWWIAVRYLRFLAILLGGLLMIGFAFDFAWVIQH